MKSFIKILGAGALGSAPSFLLCLEGNIYMFNCGEISQRLFAEYKLSVNVNNIFITQPTWNAIGGIPGFMLNSLENGNPNVLYIHSNNGVRELFTTYNKIFKSTGASFQEVTTVKDFGDGMVSIKMIPVNLASDIEEPVHKRIKSDISGFAGGILSALKRQKLNLQKITPVVLYVCKLKEVPGKICTEKAKDLGVHFKYFRDLKSNRAVILENGQRIEPDQIFSVPTRPGRVFIVVDCPSIKHLEPIAEQLAEYFSVDLSFIFHMTPPEVLYSEEYQAFIKNFAKVSKHILMNHSVSDNPLLLESVSTVTNITNHFLPRYIPHLKASYGKIESKNLGILAEMIENKAIEAAVPLSTFHLEPKLFFEDYKGFIEERVENTIEGIKTTGTTPDRTSRFSFYPPKGEFSVTVFGTGACLPGKYRNVTGIGVNWYHANRVYSGLLDPGEGTFHQIYRMLDSADSLLISNTKKSIESIDELCEIDRFLLCLTFIYVTHSHADHHLGLITILRQRQKLLRLLDGKLKNEFSQPLKVVVPPPVKTFLTQYQGIEAIEQVGIFLPNEVGKNFMKSFGIQTFELIAVQHAAPCLALKLQFQNNQKSMIFSGDTIPCKQLIERGREVDLLIHEATFDDKKETEARIKTHSTFGQVFELAKEMKAKQVIFTHFSQRYPHLNDAIIHLESKYISCKDFGWVFAIDHFTWNSSLTNEDLHKFQNENVELNCKISLLKADKKGVSLFS
jgi:ribonuclease Z